MSLDEEPVIVSVVAIEETSFVIDVVTPPIVPAIDVTVIDPAVAVAIDIAGGPVDVTGVEVTSFVVDVVTPPGLSAVDVTVGDPAAVIIVDIPGESGGGGDDEVIGGIITIGPTPPPSPDANDVWIDTEGAGGGGGIAFPLLAPDGTYLAPSYSFADHPYDGIYDEDGSLVFSINADTRLHIRDFRADFSVPLYLDYADETGSLIMPHNYPPVAPDDGSVWTTTAGMFVQINGTTVGPLGAGGGSVASTTTRVMANGLVIPYYLYPDNPYTDANVQLLLDLMRTYHDVPVLVVVNPANGPGTVMDGNWSAFIRMVQAAGGKVCGYVSTVYAARAEADVKADIDLWLSVYSTSRIDGIFLDEQTWETGPGNVGSDYVDLYKRYTDYCHAASLSPVIANPGTNQQGAYFATWTADIILVHEQTTWPSEASMEGNFVGGHADYSYTRRGALVYNQSTLDAGELATLRKNVQWVYVTDDNLTAGILNPWDNLPTYLDALFAALSE